jgi:hypothetical protein
MKKKSIIWMIALVSVSLFFWGCPTEAEDDKETFTDVPTVTASTGTINGVTNTNPTGLTVSAKKSNKTGIVYITLEGDGTFPNANTDPGSVVIWGAKSDTAHDDYFYVTLHGLLPAAGAFRIQQINGALSYYDTGESADDSRLFDSGAGDVQYPGFDVTAPGTPYMYAPALTLDAGISRYLKDKVYASIANAQDTPDGGFGILLKKSLASSDKVQITVRTGVNSSSGLKDDPWEGTDTVYILDYSALSGVTVSASS